MPVISKRELGPARRSRHRWFAADSLSRSLTARFLVAGLVPLLAGAGLLVAQQRSAEASTASQNAHARAAATAANLERTFGSWRTALLVAADNPAPRNCYRHPEQRDQLRPEVDSLLLTLHRIAPQLIDEACFIAADGHESGSSLTVVKCWCGDRVWACVIAS